MKVMKRWYVNARTKKPIFRKITCNLPRNQSARNISQQAAFRDRRQIIQTHHLHSTICNGHRPVQHFLNIPAPIIYIQHCTFRHGIPRIQYVNLL